MEHAALVSRIEHLESLVSQLASTALAGPTHNIMTRAEAAKYARVGLSLLDEAIRAGDLVPIRKGRRVLLRREAVEAWLRDLRSDA